jgi:hypothetical protein
MPVHARAHVSISEYRCYSRPGGIEGRITIGCIHCSVGTWEPRVERVSQGGRWLHTTWEKMISSISSFLPRVPTYVQ